MALKSTVYKATLHIADMDRAYYADHTFTLACHPSETEERLMVRILAFALNATDALEFSRGLSADDEPDLWEKNLTGEILHWIELGQPDESRVRKACNRAQHVTIYGFSGRAPAIWWEKNRSKLERFDNLTVINIPAEASAALALLLERTINLQITIEDGTCWVSSNTVNIEITPEFLHRAKN